MQASEIMMFEAINPVDQTHVDEIAESIRENGWIGAPILVIASHGMLVTGSHRLAALRQIDEAWDDDEWFDLDTLGDIESRSMTSSRLGARKTVAPFTISSMTGSAIFLPEPGSKNGKAKLSSGERRLSWISITSARI